MVKKVFLILLLCAFSFQTKAQTVDLAGAIVDDVADDVKYEQQKEAGNIADDRGVFSFLNFSFIKKPLSIFSDKQDTPQDEQQTLDAAKILDETPQKQEKQEKQETPIERATRLAEEGNADMALSLGYMYLYGQDGVKADYQKAFHFYELAARTGNTIALNNLGSLYFSGIGTEPDYQKAAELFLKAAQNGSDDSAVNLGFIYLSTGKKKYFEPAINLFEQAAKAGNNTAKFMLGYAYYKGFVVSKDDREAISFIRQAADAKFDEAQYVFASMYANGEGIAKNYGNAVKYYRSAAAQGNVEAMVALGDILAQGKMYPKNLVQAHILYNVASVYSEKAAGTKRDSLESSLKIEELLEAQAEAEKYQEKPSELTTYIRQTFGNNVRRYIDENLGKTTGGQFENK